MSKRKPTKVAKVANSGERRSIAFDPLAEAQLNYLIAFYREVIGVKTSSSGVVRRALTDFVVLADEMTRLARIVGPSHKEARAERLRMERAMQGEDAPWPAGALEGVSAGPFPTPDELREQHADKRTVLERLRPMWKGRGQAEAVEDAEQADTQDESSTAQA